MTRTCSLSLSLLLSLFLASASAEVIMMTEGWRNSDADFAKFDERIAATSPANLLARDGVKVADTGGLPYGTLRMLTDGSAGIRVGKGRIGIDGHPAIITFYLGEPKAIKEAGVFTNNSDARVNQDYEVRFFNNAEHPGVKPTFRADPDLTTGETVIGNNSGGFHSWFRSADGSDLPPGKADWVQFRFWRTYNVKAGAPGKSKSTATSWTSFIELEVLGDGKDVVATPAFQVYQKRIAARSAMHKAYVKKGTWQETMRVSREAFMRVQADGDGTPGFESWSSAVLRGGNAPAQVKVNVSDIDLLWLTATVGGDTYSSDQAIWGEPKLIGKDGKVTDLASLKPAFSKVGFGKLEVNRNHIKSPLRIAGRQFKTGFWAHAPSQLCFKLSKKFESFEAWVGIDVTAGKNGSVQFHVDDRPRAEVKVDDIWGRLSRDFSDAESKRQMQWEKEDNIWTDDWNPGDLKELARRYVTASHRNKTLAAMAAKLGAAGDVEALKGIRDIYHRSRRLDKVLDKVLGKVRSLPIEALGRAIRDLAATCGNEYPNGAAYLSRLSDIEKKYMAIVDGTTETIHAIARVEALHQEFTALQEEALLANPLLDFDRLLLVRRSARNLGLPANWQGNCSLGRSGFDNEITVLSPATPDGKLTSLYRPKARVYVGDVDLHFDADRMLFSSIGTNNRWQIFEMKADGTGLRQVTPGEDSDVDNYDACYMPDDRIIFSSTASFTGVPCVFGSSHVAMLYRMESDGSKIRQLCFEQDHDWYPAVLNDGRVLYARWEYTDTPHSQTRLLMRMNPDGTGQSEYYGSNSQWPNSIFYARPVPNHPTKVVGVISGHHGVRRMGELIVFDPAEGRHEVSGVVQRIPGYGKKVEPIIRDRLVNGSWPRFLHPYPLSEKYYLVSCKPTPRSHWGIYLVDVFDNMLLLHEEPGYALLEPVPFRKTPRPPVIPDKYRPGRKDATVYVADVYEGGLKGIPRGTVKEMRLFSYHFAYQGMGGLLGVVGMDGPWDIKRVIGTVPVEEDGSAMFKVPANTPISLQPLDSDGKALQLMRSWMTAMPGEVVSCVGCHARQNSTVPSQQTIAATKTPSEIKPWLGPTRGFSYPREVQPVIDKYCLACHNGKPQSDSAEILDLRGNVSIKSFAMRTPGNGGGRGGKFSVGYANLHKYVRRPGIESDYHMLTPMEFHADTTELVQLLTKGHYNVKLDRDAWSRLVTWIDLNAPYHGTWGENIRDPGKQRQRRRELLKKYAGIDEDPETVPETKTEPVKPIMPTPIPEPEYKAVACPSWPFDAAEAKKRQTAAAKATSKTVDLGEGVKMDLTLIPAGEFVMGDRNGHPDERPLARVKIDKPFWMGRCEVSNEQYAHFDSEHDSHVESKNTYQFGVHGYPLDSPSQPVVRVSWQRAVEFCEWLSEKTGQKFSLPTESEWEYACRAGSAEPFSFGNADADFSGFANMADAKLKEFASNPYTVDQPLRNPTPYDDWMLKDTRFNDRGLVTVAIGTYKPNAWGLHDMHGNVCEWTRSAYRSYPYRENERGNDIAVKGGKVVRGGSWRDRPKRCRSAFRLSYRPYQRVFNVGFRVVSSGSQISEDKK